MSVVRVVKNAVREFSEDDCSTLASAIAYSAFFSIFPLLLAATAILGFVVSDPQTRNDIMSSVYANMPASGGFVSQTLQGVIEHRGSVSVVAVLLLIVSGRGVFQSVVHALNRAFETPKERGLIGTTVLVFVLLFGVGLLLVLSILVTAIIQALASISVLGLGPYKDTIILTPIQVVLSLLVSLAMFELLYLAAPNTEQTWRDVLPGAIVAAILFEIAKLVFVWYVKNFMGTDNVYGAIGGVIVLLTWCYFSAMILLIGAEVASEYAKLRRAEQQVLRTPRPAPGIVVPRHEPVLTRAAAIGSTLFAFALALVAVTRRRRAEIV